MYEAKEAAARLQVSKDTLRYYEKAGLLPPIHRNQKGHRCYSQSDLDWIFLIRCLRDTGMPIAGIKNYTALLKENTVAAIEDRYAILQAHHQEIHKKMAVYQRMNQLIEKKLTFYEAVLAQPDTSCMSMEEEWTAFRGALRGAEHE